MERSDVVLDNGSFRLVIGEDGTVKSLRRRHEKDELLMTEAKVKLCSVTQERPFNNEVKLSTLCKRTTFQADSIHREGNLLFVTFEIVPVKAVLEICEAHSYIALTLREFQVDPDDYAGLNFAAPPVTELRLFQLPVRRRRHFGSWLNVVWDEEAAVNVLATSPRARITATKRNGGFLLCADAIQEAGLLGTGAALITCRTDHLMDRISSVERDFHLPHGARSRTRPELRSSNYWSWQITPRTVDEHIAWAKRGGFTQLLIFYKSIFFDVENGYRHSNEFRYREEYPNGLADLAAMLQKIKAAGMTPGLHILPTHIGIETPYVTPHVDRRLHLQRHFTLARPLSETDTTVYVDENPLGCVAEGAARVLRFGTEAIAYTGYTTERPYAFTGCTRGHYGTEIFSHPLGEIGGLLDVSEYGGTSIYIDQNTDLPDEIADRIAEVYAAGFEFLYFDGAEGVQAPYDFHVANAQYRVYRKLSPEPRFSEGAARTHFSWHMLSGGNAFDACLPQYFRHNIAAFPMEEAPRLRADFTRINFGWWGFYKGTQPDLWEYGNNCAAAWDCPITLLENREMFRNYPRADDCLEVLRRWEDVRCRDWLSDNQRDKLRAMRHEYHLMINEVGEYELIPYAHDAEAVGGNTAVRVFLFERNDEQWALYWGTEGDGELEFPLSSDCVHLCEDLPAGEIPCEESGESVHIPFGRRRYLHAPVYRSVWLQAWQNAKIIRFD